MIFNFKKPENIDNKILDYVNHIKDVAAGGSYDQSEASVNLPLDINNLNKVKELVSQKVGPNLKYIIDIGIGGSNLGTKAVYDAKYGYFDMLTPNRYPKMIFSDTVDPEYTESLLDFLKNNVKSLDEILLVMVSKSGGTTETAANFDFIYSTLSAKFPQLQSRIVVITDEGSNLWNKATEKNVSKLSIPKNVGGRYSVMSSVGLFPLLACGINIENILLGARSMRDKCLDTDINNNPALASALILFDNYKNGKVINDNFIFHPELESLGKWYRQLMGESIGKEKDLEGNTVNVGITPTVSIGSTDLHSMGQLYLGGPKNKLTTFILSNVGGNTIKTSTSQFFQGIVNDIENKSPSQIMTAILEGVKIAYTKNNLPFTEVVLDDLSEKSLGGFMQFKMIEMIYLGKLLNVNTFDQPNVESYKIETKKILGEISGK